MKHRILIAIVITALAILLTQPIFALAGGDKVRGENGVGSVVQQQISDHPYEWRPGQP